MLIADQLKTDNRSEYLLYMWQVEDILRAYGCDADALAEGYLTQFNVDDETRARLTRWYTDLCAMMREEGVKAKGHLQINKNTLQELDELHRRLLASTRYADYRAAYFKVLPAIVELRSKSDADAPELEACFDALYGVMLLRLQRKPVSDRTVAAVKDISGLLALLSDYYRRDAAEPLEF